jgi:predicted oxidoreductase
MASDLSFSRVIHGHWRLADWQLNKNQIVSLINRCLEMGVSTIDTADIYGYHSCEGLLGQALQQEKTLRNNLEIVTKCGIKLTGEKFPERKIKIYDYRKEYIIQQVEQSLTELHTDRIDALLLHRPSPILNPEEVNAAFHQLYNDGKVRQFGVSNFTPMQFQSLQSSIDFELVTNQIEVSPICFQHFENDNFDYFMKQKIHPMAWSPLAGGKLFKEAEKNTQLLTTIGKLSKEYDCSMDTIVYAWLFHHPSGIMPIVGSRYEQRIKNAVDALKIHLTDEQWFCIYIEGRGKDID